MSAQWECQCLTAHDEAEPSCTQCGTVRPPALDPLPEEWETRFTQMVTWIDNELAKRPTFLASVTGAGIMQIINAAQRNPRATYRTLQGTGNMLGEIIGWTERGTPPDETAFTAALGPPER